MNNLKKKIEYLSDEKLDALLEIIDSLEKSSDNTISNYKKSHKCNFKKIGFIILLVLVILFASLFGAFAFSSDFRHAAMEVFEDEGDDYSRVSSASADRGTADAVTFTFINYTAINCKGGRKGMEASFLAKL